MKFLITGGCGFIGSNLAEAVLSRKEELAIFDDLSRQGSRQNLEWLGERGRFAFHQADIADAQLVDQTVQDFRPDVIFHLAGQVAMTTSLSDPKRDFNTNVVGGHNVLEAARRLAPRALVVYSSSNKVYGDLEQLEYVEQPKRYAARGYDHGFDESMPLQFTTPYGCSKGAIDQYMLDYARVYGLKTIVFRHSSIFGRRQFSTYDQGWIGWFVRQAVETARQPDRQPFTISGNGKQVRDVLFIDDLIALYFKAVEHKDKVAGQAMNIGGGGANSVSLLELFDFLEEQLRVKLRFEELPFRKSDQKVFIADITKARRLLEWSPELGRDEGLKQMIDWTAANV